MASCPLARILTRSDAECERERCQWWVNFEGGNCWVVVTLMALHSYLYMKMAGTPDLGPPPGSEDLREKYRINPDFVPPTGPEDFQDRFRIDPKNFKL